MTAHPLPRPLRALGIRPRPRRADPPGRDRAARLPRACSALAACLAGALLLAGCAGPSGSSGPKGRPSAEQARAQLNPTDRGAVSATPFTPALRCMDALMFSAGTRDLTLLMEELRDATQRVPVSARDMMASALSDMTRRSRALRVSAFGADQAHLQQLLQQAQAGATEGALPNPFAVLPQYSLRGSISQLDEDVQRRGTSLGAAAERFGLRLGSETRLSVLGFDAALVDSATFQLLPGVSSRNTVVVTRRDRSAGDGRAQLRGAGVEFAFSTAHSEGTAQAARSMVELAAVELVGKLTRLPYWQCLALADDHAEVLRETEDWFLGLGMTGRTALLQQRLRQQGWYDGAVDGRDSAAWRSAQALALAAVRAQGQPLPDLVAGEAAQLTWFRHVLARPLPPAPPRPAATAPAALRVVKHAGGGANGGSRLEVSADLPGYVYCYAVEPASGSIRRVFPNRLAADPALLPGQTLHLPGATGIRLPDAHDFACVHAPTEIYAALPPSLRWGDFEAVRMTDLPAVRDAFAQVAGPAVVLARAAPPPMVAAPAPRARPRPAASPATTSARR